MRAVRVQTGSESVDRRMAFLLDSEFDRIDGRKSGGGEMAFRLRQCVRFAAGHKIGVDWPQLLADLKGWMHPSKRVRKQWAQSYYGD
jgi:CRISPR type I-E-associated protein CasB/Cse2